MALVDFSAVTGILVKLFARRVETQLNRSLVLPLVLDVRPEAGQNIQWVARSGTEVPTSAVIADGDDVSVFNSDTREAAVLQYGTYHDGFKVSGKALNAAYAAGNPEQLAMLFAEELSYSVERLAVAIGDDFYDGSGGTDIIAGLLDATNPAIGDIGTYAGLDRSTRTYWKGNVLDALGAGVSKDLFKQLKRSIYNATGGAPDIWICDATQHDYFGSLLDPNRRAVQDVQRADGSVVKLDPGWMDNALFFDGVVVLKDKRCPASKMIALNSMYVSMAQLANSPEQLKQGAGMLMLGGTPETQKGAQKTKLSAQILPLAQTGRAVKTALFCDPQLVVKRPQACGYITGLAA